MEIAPDAPLDILGMQFNVMTLYMSWIVMAVLLFGAWRTTRQMSEVPSRWQLCMEMFVDFFDSLAQQALGERGRTYLPFAGTVFLFVWGCNLIGMFPGCVEPTRDLNTPIGLAVLAISTAHLSCIVVKGFREWWWGFFEPAFPASGKAGLAAAIMTALVSVGVYLLIVVKVCAGLLPGLGAVGKAITIVVLLLVGAAGVATTVFAFQKRRVPNVLMAPLNFVGELGKSISLPFRLYGNIFGGAVIIIVISALTSHVVFPLGLMFFFCLFVGTVQAFVFSMLSLTYIAVALAEDETAEDTGDESDAAGQALPNQSSS